MLSRRVSDTELNDPVRIESIRGDGGVISRSYFSLGLFYLFDCLAPSALTA